MANKNIKPQADKFDECVSELSLEAQEYFAVILPHIVKQLANGGGMMSAKELVFQLARFIILYEDHHGTKHESYLSNMPAGRSDESLSNV